MIEDVGLPAPRELDSLLITVDEVDLSGLRAAADGELLETHVMRCSIDGIIPTFTRATST